MVPGRGPSRSRTQAGAGPSRMPHTLRAGEGRGRRDATGPGPGALMASSGARRGWAPRERLEDDGDQLRAHRARGPVRRRGRSCLEAELVEGDQPGKLGKLVGELDQVVIAPADPDLHRQLRVELLRSDGAPTDLRDNQPGTPVQALDAPEHLRRL